MQIREDAGAAKRIKREREDDKVEEKQLADNGKGGHMKREGRGNNNVSL